MDLPILKDGGCGLGRYRVFRFPRSKELCLVEWGETSQALGYLSGLEGIYGGCLVITYFFKALERWTKPLFITISCCFAHTSKKMVSTWKMKVEKDLSSPVTELLYCLLAYIQEWL